MSTMMKVYVVNLVSRPDRLAHIASELGRVGVPFEHVPAVDAKASPLIKELADRGPGRSGSVISDGALACLLTHRIIWQRLLDSDAAHCAVLEDDVLLSDGFAQFIETGWVPEDADVVKLETYANRVHIGATPARRMDGHNVCRLHSRHAGSAAYVVSRSAAESLLAHSTSGIDAVDELLFNEDYSWMPSATVYQVTPAPAIQADRMPPEALPVPTPDWMASSIPQRDIQGDTIARESAPARLMRRAGNEIRARLSGCRYSMVPFVR